MIARQDTPEPPHAREGSMTLTELRDALKKATGPSRELDRQIDDSLIGSSWGVPAYTASIDAAVTLVPLGRAREVIEDPSTVPSHFVVTLFGPDPAPDFTARAATEPVALCLARLEYELAKAPTPDAATGEAE